MIYNEVLSETAYFRYEFPAIILLVVLVTFVFVISCLLYSASDKIENDGAIHDDLPPDAILSKKGIKSALVMHEQIKFILLH